MEEKKTTKKQDELVATNLFGYLEVMLKSEYDLLLRDRDLLDL